MNQGNLDIEVDLIAAEIAAHMPDRGLTASGLGLKQVIDQMDMLYQLGIVPPSRGNHDPDDSELRAMFSCLYTPPLIESPIR